MYLQLAISSIISNKEYSNNNNGVDCVHSLLYWSLTILKIMVALLTMHCHMYVNYVNHTTYKWWWECKQSEHWWCDDN